MNKTLMKHVIMLLSSFLAILVIFAVPMTVQAADAGSSVDKQPLHISMNYVKEPGKGHITPGALEQLSPDM